MLEKLQVRQLLYRRDEVSLRGQRLPKSKLKAIEFVSTAPAANLSQAVYHCLYSQCQTAQFGTALHAALTQCSGITSEHAFLLPHLIRHQSSRTRQHSQSISGLGPATTPASGFHSISRIRSVVQHTGSLTGPYYLIRSASQVHTHTRSFTSSYNTLTAIPDFSLPPVQTKDHRRAEQDSD